MEYEPRGKLMQDKQSLFRRAEQTAEASCFGSSSRPLSIILIIESSRGCFKTSNLSDVSRSRVTIPHSDHPLIALWFSTPHIYLSVHLSYDSHTYPLCLRWSTTYVSEITLESTSNHLIKTVKTLDITTFLMFFVLFSY